MFCAASIWLQVGFNPVWEASERRIQKYTRIHKHHEFTVWGLKQIGCIDGCPNMYVYIISILYIYNYIKIDFDMYKCLNMCTYIYIYIDIYTYIYIDTHHCPQHQGEELFTKPQLKLKKFSLQYGAINAKFENNQINTQPKYDHYRIISIGPWPPKTVPIN